MTLYNQDCLVGLKTIKDSTVDLVITDPPYKIISGGSTQLGIGDPTGIFNRKFTQSNASDASDVRSGKLFKHNDITFNQWLPEVYRVLKNGTHCYIMVNDRNLATLITQAEAVGFKLVNVLIWKKNNVTPNKWYMKSCEFIVMLRKGKAKNINNMGSNQCIEVKNPMGNKLHPTQKPVELIDVLLLNSSVPNELVLDPFMGSGSVAVSAIKNNRQYLGYELDEKYFKIAQDQINNIQLTLL